MNFAHIVKHFFEKKFIGLSHIHHETRIILFHHYFVSLAIYNDLETFIQQMF